MFGKNDWSLWIGIIGGALAIASAIFQSCEKNKQETIAKENNEKFLNSQKELIKKSYEAAFLLQNWIQNKLMIVLLEKSFHLEFI